MTASELIAELSALGVRVKAEDGQLRVRAPKGAVTPALKEQLALHKPELIALLSASVDSAAISKISRDTAPPVSTTQERFLFLAQMYPDGVAYNLPNLHKLNGPLDLSVFEQAVSGVVIRHEALRTVFAQTVAGMVQTILSEPNHSFQVVDLADHADPKAAAIELSRQQANKSFDMLTGPLFRAVLFRVSDDEHYFCWTLHHSISDGWSSMIFVRELKQIYESLQAGDIPGLPSPPIQYADFGAWERSQLETGAFDEQIAYWKRQFESMPPVLSLPTDRPRPPVLSYRGDSFDFALPADLVTPLKAMARKQGVTLFTVLLTAYSILLQRYSGQDDICVGSPIARRNRPEIEDVYGCFINALAIRSQLDGDPLLSDAISQVRATCLDAFGNQDVPFERIVEELHPERNTGITPLFQAMFIFHVQDTRKVDELGSVKLTPIDIHAQAAKFDLTLEITEVSNGARGFIEYSTDLFDQATIERLAKHYLVLLHGLVTSPDGRLSDLPLLLESEHRDLVEGFNSTARDYPATKTFADLIAEQAAKTPNSLAVIGADNQKLTYRQLDQRSNQLARYLVDKGITATSLIGVYLDRTVEMMCALLAIAKSGAAYVPLDPMFPPDRLSYMAEDASIRWVLTQQSLGATTPGADSQPIVLDAIEQTISSLSTEPVQPESLAERAYVIYTSGSTGQPKGVQVGHQALTNFLCSMVREPGINQTDRLLAVTTLSFDIAALELYGPLVVGGCTVLASREEAMDPARLTARLLSSEATMMQATPATWRMLIDSDWAGDSNLKVLCGGEALPRELATQLSSRCSELWNMYGPTETTIWSTVHRIELGEGVVPVGQPIANTQTYVLDQALNPVPIDVLGELYIGGDGVADGYLNRPELTSERFLPNPFAHGSQIYRTGDRARWRASGVLEVLGRLDDQVKLRGFRIEPGEIRAKLVGNAQVGDAVVTVALKAGGDSQLVAHLVAVKGVVPNVGEIRNELKESLPDYMIPTAWVWLDELPLTPNGKVDKNALAAPDSNDQGVASGRVAPRDEQEKRIADIWARLLGTSEVGVTQSFFELGGHSLLAVRLVTELENELGLKLPLMRLFQGATIEQIAQTIDARNVPESGTCYPLRLDGHLTPLFMVGSNPRYRDAVSKLHAERPVYQLDAYGLQATKLESGWKPYGSIEQMADEMLKEIRKIQPEGPYEIAGGCEGSLIALEVALRLQRGGEAVNRLIVWITPAPGEPLTAVFNRSTARRLWYQFQSLRSKGSIRELGLRGQWQLVQHEMVEYSLFSAMLKYRPGGKFEGVVHVARVPFGNDSLVSDRALGWGEMATGGARTTQMPGDHDTWLQEHADVFGEFLEACFTDVQQAVASSASD